MTPAKDRGAISTLMHPSKHFHCIRNHAKLTNFNISRISITLSKKTTNIYKYNKDKKIVQVTYFYNLLLLHDSWYLEAHGTTELGVRSLVFLSFHAYILRLVHRDLKVVHKLNYHFHIFPRDYVVKHACNMVK